MNRNEARAYLAQQLTDAASLIASLDMATADAGESTQQKEHTKQELLKVKKALVKFGQDHRDALSYFLGSEMSLLSDAFENIQKAIEKLR